MSQINVRVDGVSYRDDVEPRTLLVHYLREQLGKVGTVVGCDTSNCGACTVHLDGEDRAALHGRAVELDRARAAVARVAADDGADLAELLTQVVDQEGPRFDVVAVRDSVDAHVDLGHRSSALLAGSSGPGVRGAERSLVPGA